MSITLPSNLISSLVVGGITVETDASSAVTNLEVDYVAGLLRFTLKGGTTSGPNFSPGAVSPLYEVTINGFTGTWYINGAGLSGTLSGAALTSIQTIFKNLRNNAETFVVNQNLFPGATLVAW